MMNDILEMDLLLKYCSTLYFFYINLLKYVQKIEYLLYHFTIFVIDIKMILMN